MMGIDDLRKKVEAALKVTTRRATQVYLSGFARQSTFEADAYYRMLELINAGQDVSRIVFLDDVVAQGATRALLQAGYSKRNVKLAIICGQQEVIPLGLPATFIVHDTQAEVDHAFAILEQKREKGVSRDLSWRSGFRVAPAEVG
jgi:DNA-binding LacI/PurR family transcriptional regulator